MCLICLEFNKRGDLDDALSMVDKAKKEPSTIDAQHLDILEFQLKSLKTVKETIGNSGGNDEKTQNRG